MPPSGRVSVPPVERSRLLAPSVAGAVVGCIAGIAALSVVFSRPAPARFSAPVVRPGLNADVAVFRREPAGPARLVIESASEARRTVDASGASSEHSVRLTGLTTGVAVTVHAEWEGGAGPSTTFTAGAGPVSAVRVERRGASVAVAVATTVACTCRLAYRAPSGGPPAWLESASAGTTHRFAIPAERLPLASRLHAELTAGTEHTTVELPLDVAAKASLAQ